MANTNLAIAIDTRIENHFNQLNDIGYRNCCLCALEHNIELPAKVLEDAIGYMLVCYYHADMLMQVVNDNIGQDSDSDTLGILGVAKHVLHNFIYEQLELITKHPDKSEFAKHVEAKCQQRLARYPWLKEVI